MRSGSFYDRLAELSKHMYDNPNKNFHEWKVIDTYSDNSGIFITLFDIGNKEILFSIRGTDIFENKDWKADYKLFEKVAPNQIKSADNYYNSIKNNYQNIVFTGYSLGGSIAQILGSRYGNETITIEAFAAGNIEKSKYTKNIINFGNLLDPIFKADLSNHIGDVYAIPSKLENNTVGSMVFHIYPLFGKPSTARKIDKNMDIKTVYKDIKCVEPTVRNTYHLIKDGMIPSTQNTLRNFNKKAQQVTKRTLNKLKP